MAEHSDLSSVLNHFKISKADSELQVSDDHLQKISSSCGEKWRLLPTYLGLGDIVVSDVICEHPQNDEHEKRFSFFKKWKRMRGLQATYRSLINGLLEINYRSDAEYVCALLKDRGMYVDHA
jgi:hypothetical protein